MNRGNIKLVIDQLNSLHLSGTDVLIDSAAHVNAVIQDSVAILETLDDKVAEQAAVIEKLRDSLENCKGWLSPDTPFERASIKRANEALATPTDSKQILIDWMKEQLGDPTAYFFRDDPAYFAMPGSGFSHEYPKQALNISPLYKLPKCLR